MSVGADGGRTALAGYLYQILGTVGLRAQAHVTMQGQDTDENDGELRTLLRVVARGRLEHEQDGQDATVRWDEGGDAASHTLIQFKYSNQRHPPNIDQGQLREIVRRLADSARQVRDEGATSIGYVLITNRGLSDEASILHRDAADAERTVADLNRPQCEVLASLRVILCRTQAAWRAALTTFGKQYGALGDEIDRGIARLVGNLLERTVGYQDADIPLADLIRAFTDCPDATPLTAEAVAPIARHRLEIPPPQLELGGPPVPRSSMLDALTVAARQHALIILAGFGGTGKSVALWQWAHAMAASGDRHGGAFTAFAFADWLAPNWVTNTVCLWRTLPDSHRDQGENRERTLQRITSANEGMSAPYLHLALDGLDETHRASDSLDVLGRLIRWCWEEEAQVRRGQGGEHRMTLVVTCRDARDIMSNFLGLGGRGIRIPEGLGPKVLTLGDFTRDELRAVAQEQAAGIYPRIERVLGGTFPDTAPSPGGFAAPQVVGGKLRAQKAGVRPADRGIVEALHHPVIWRALLELEPQQQDRAVDNDTAATRDLAQVVVDRFASKVIVRRRGEFLDEEAVRAALRAIAAAGRTQPDRQAYAYADDWETPACARPGAPLNGGQAGSLYLEAISGGLIEVVSRGVWRWRHGLVRGYLVDEVTRPRGGTGQ